MPKKNKADALMNEAIDKAADALKGVNYQDSTSITDQFHAAVDKASELASARAKANANANASTNETVDHVADALHDASYHGFKR